MEEVKLAPSNYECFKIYTHVGAINNQKKYDFISQIKYWDPIDEWSIEDNEKTDSEIKVTFNGEPTDLEVSMGLSKYGVVLESFFFGWKNDYPHRKICNEISHKITWQKQVFLLTNKGMVLLKKKHRLKKK